MPLEYRAGLVRNVVGKRVGPVSMLLHIGHDHAGQRRDLLRVAGHAEICFADEIGVEGGPLRVSHEGLHGKADTAGTCESGRGGPISKRNQSPMSRAAGLAQVRLGYIQGHVAVEINVDGPRVADVTGEQRGRAFDDPALADEVEALQQPVVGHLPLELLERPAAPGGEIPELVGESPAGGRGGLRRNGRRSSAPRSGLGTS